MHLLKIITATLLFCCCVGNVYADLNEGLIAYYPFDGDANDSIGSYNGTESGGVSFITDQERGVVASFDGLNDSIDFNTVNFNNTLGVNSDFTVSIFVKGPLVSTTGGNSMIFTNYNSTPKNLTIAYKESDENFYFQARSQEQGLSGDTFYISDFIDGNNWNHLVLVKTGTTFNCYINGLKVGSFEYNDSTFVNTSTFKLFRSTGTWGRYVSGTADDLRIYNRALSNSEISTLYSSNTTCIDSTGTVSSNLDIHMPSLDYQTLFGSQNIWVDLEYYGTGPNGELLWKLKNYGTND